jgi:arabinan endo-1,5-alpha-L-arabinosidase
MKLIRLFLLLLVLQIGAAYAQEVPTGSVPAHDPVMIRQDGIYYLFFTGRGINMWSSKDMMNWKQEKPVFDVVPTWVTEAIPAFRGNSFWAPDISYNKGIYYLYYACSAFGKNTSVIGLATNTTLHTDDPAYKWVDQGKIIQSHPGQDNWNAIDPNLAVDKNGTPYLFFGSFWDGIKIVKLTKDRMHTDQPLDNLTTIASRKKSSGDPNPPAFEDNPKDAGGNAIEGPFVYKKGKYYYLFTSIDYCCKGPKSTYKMIVARSKDLLGPYLDTNGVDMAHGGGNLVLEGDKNWYGVGHNAVCDFDGTDYLIFHGYSAADNGKSKLRIEKLKWVKDWPVVELADNK